MGAKTDMTLFLASTMQLCTKLYIITLDKLSVRFDTDRPHPDKHYIRLVCCGTHRSPKQHHILLSSTMVLTGLPDYNTIPCLFRSTQRSPQTNSIPLLCYCIHRSPMPLLCGNYTPHTHARLLCNMHISAALYLRPSILLH